MKSRLIYLYSLFVLVFLGATQVTGQVTFTQWTFEPLEGTNANPTPNQGIGTAQLVGSMSGPGTATGMNTATGCGNQTSGTSAWAIGTANPGSTNESSGAQFNTSTVGYENITVQWEQRWSGTATNTLRFQYTTDGSTWNNFTMTAGNTTFCNGSLDNGRFQTNTTSDQFRRISVDLSGISGVENNSNFGFRIVAAHYQTTGQFRQVANPANIATGGTWRFDNVFVSGTVTSSSDPLVSVSSNFSLFFYPLNDGPSESQILEVSGINLTNDIVVTPPANFEIGLNEAGPYQSSALNITPLSGTVASTDVYARLVGGLSSGDYNGNFLVSSDDPNSPVSISAEGLVISETLTYLETFGNTVGAFPLGWTTSGTGAANWSVGTTTPSTGSGQANLQDAGTAVGQEAVITMNRALTTIGTSNVVVSFLARKTAAYSGNAELDFSVDGISWTNVSFVDVPNDANWGEVSVLLPPAAGNVENLRLRFRTTRANTSGNYRIDDFTVAPAGPAVNVSASTTTASEDDQTQITITVTLEQVMPTDETIELSVAGTNINENDYNLSSTSVTIFAGQTTGTVTLEILDDNLNEGLETLVVNIASFSSALSPGANSFVEIEIADNDDAVNLLQVGVANPIIDFNELQNNGTNLFDVTKGFYLFEEGANANSLYRAGDGSSDTGDTYSYGANASNERALGSLSTGPLSPNTFGAKLVNTTGQLINALHISYVGEQWRVGAGAEDALTFSYSLDATDLSNGTWVEVSALTFNAPVINGSGSALNGNDPVNQVNLDFEIDNIQVSNNGTIWIKWVDENIASTDHGMAIDDLVFTPIYNLNANAPVNDEPCGALNITSAGQTSLNTFGFLTDMTCNNQTASNQDANYFNVPFTCGDNGFSMWYTFTTPMCGVNGTVPFIIEVSTNNPGTNFDTRLAIFQSDDNTCSGNLTQVVCNDNNNSNAFSFLCSNSSNPNVSAIEMTDLLPNTQYWIYVDGANSETGAFELSGRVVAFHTAQATGNGTSITINTEDRGAGLYTYYYQQLSTTGYSISNSPTALTDTRTLASGFNYNTQVMYRCGANAQQNQWYRTQPEGVMLSSDCAVVNDMTCTFNGPNSYTLTWTEPTEGLYTDGGLSGYRIKRNPVGSTGVYTFSNPAVVCENGMCSVTLGGNSPTGFNWTIETRCSATKVQVGNTTTCGPVDSGMAANSDATININKASNNRVFSFVNVEAEIEFVDVQMHDAYGEFGLNTPLIGDYEIFVNDNNEINWRRVETTSIMNFDFVIVPNPSNAITTVHLNTVVEAGSFTIVDAMGRMIQSGDISNTDKVNFDAAQLQSGVYMVVLTVGNIQMTKRLVVTN